jgi:hypothetical protein
MRRCLIVTLFAAALAVILSACGGGTTIHTTPTGSPADAASAERMLQEQERMVAEVSGHPADSEVHCTQGKPRPAKGRPRAAPTEYDFRCSVDFPDGKHEDCVLQWEKGGGFNCWHRGWWTAVPRAHA